MDFNFDEIENAFFFVSGAPYGELDAYLCLESGKIYYDSFGGDFLDEDSEELPADIDDPEKFISIPHKNDLDLGKPLVFDFVNECAPHLERNAEEIFSKKGAYGRWKNLLESVNLLEAWYEYESKAEKKALLAWCEENNLRLRDSAP